MASKNIASPRVTLAFHVTEVVFIYRYWLVLIVHLVVSRIGEVSVDGCHIMRVEVTVLIRLFYVALIPNI